MKCSFDLRYLQDLHYQLKNFQLCKFYPQFNESSISHLLQLNTLHSILYGILSKVFYCRFVLILQFYVFKKDTLAAKNWSSKHDQRTFSAQVKVTSMLIAAFIFSLFNVNPFSFQFFLTRGIRMHIPIQAGVQTLRITC